MQRRQFLAVLLLLALFVPSSPARASDSSQLMAALKAIPAQADKFRSMMSNLSAGQFKLVDAGSVVAAGDMTAYRASVRKSASDISDLRDTLSHTTVTGTDGVITPLKKVLLAKNVTIDRVIAIYVGGDGQITLFYQ